MGAAKIFRTDPCARFVARETEVAHDQSMCGKASVEKGFPPILMLHAFAQRVADQTDVITGGQGQFSSV